MLTGFQESQQCIVRHLPFLTAWSPESQAALQRQVSGAQPELRLVLVYSQNASLTFSTNFYISSTTICLIGINLSAVCECRVPDLRTQGDAAFAVPPLQQPEGMRFVKAGSDSAPSSWQSWNLPRKATVM